MSKTSAKPPFASCSGKDPYVFVCYAHRNSEEVYSDLSWMREQNIDIWYDEGVSPGRQWRDDVADAINQCSVFLIFMSRAAVESTHCRKEINFALQAGKNLLVVYLEQTELPAGLLLAIGDLQAVMKDGISREDYERKVLARISSHVEGVSTVTGVSPRPHRSVKRPWVIRSLVLVSVMVVTVVLVSPFFVETVNDRSGSDDGVLNFSPRDRVLLLVHNRTESEMLEESMELMLNIALRESSYINLLPKSRMRNLLQRMNQAVPDQMGTNLGLELAASEGVAAVVEAVASYQNRSYVLRARILDPITKMSVFTESLTAGTEEEILPMLGALASGIRKALGEPEDTIRKSEYPLLQVTTSNLDALRIYSSAEREVFRVSLEETIERLEQAVSLDPDFALAHSKIGTYTWAVDGNRQKAMHHWDKALSSLDRLSQRERLVVSASRAWLESPEEMERRWRLIIRMYPDDSGSHHNLGMIRWLYYNDFKGAIPYFQQALATNEGDPGSLYYLGYCLLGLGQTREAMEVLGQAAATSALTAGLADAHIVAGNYEEARKPLALTDSLTPGQAEPRMTRLIAVEISQDEMITAYDLAMEGLGMSRGSGSYQSEVGFSGALLAIAEKDDRYDFRAQLDRTQQLIASLIQEDRLWRYPVRELALTGKMAARQGLVDEAREIQAMIRQGRRQSDRLAADFEKLLAGEIFLAMDQGLQASALFQEVIERSGLYQAHESAARAYRTLGDEAMEERELAWLVSHKGQALVEAGDTLFGREMNLLDYIAATGSPVLR